MVVAPDQPAGVQPELTVVHAVAHRVALGLDQQHVLVRGHRGRVPGGAEIDHAEPYGGVVVVTVPAVPGSQQHPAGAHQGAGAGVGGGGEALRPPLVGAAVVAVPPEAPPVGDPREPCGASGVPEVLSTPSSPTRSPNRSANDQAPCWSSVGASTNPAAGSLTWRVSADPPAVDGRGELDVGAGDAARGVGGQRKVTVVQRTSMSDGGRAVRHPRHLHHQIDAVEELGACTDRCSDPSSTDQCG